MVEVTNIVASDILNAELGLRRLVNDIGESVTRYDPDKYPGMYLRFEKDAPLITVYRTGKFIITGVDSEDGSCSLRGQFLNLLTEVDIIESPGDEWFAVQSYVCAGELDQDLNLNALAIGLGLEKTECEPEQFPGLIYHPEDAESAILLFAIGKVVITGCQSIESTKEIFAGLTETVSEFL